MVIKTFRWALVVALFVILSFNISVLAESENLVSLHYESKNGIFDYDIEPGAVKEINVVLENKSKGLITNTIMIYDAVSNDNGGTTPFNPNNMVRKDVSKWCSFSVDKISLPAGGASELRFSIKVPEATPPGEYVAIFAIYTEGDAIENSSNFSVIANTSKTIDIVVRVKGEKEFNMSFEDPIRFFGASDNSVLFYIPIMNKSNYYDFPIINAQIYNEKNKMIFQQSDPLDIVYANTSINYVFSVSKDMIPNGQYKVRTKMEFGDKDNFQSVTDEYSFEIRNDIVEASVDDTETNSSIVSKFSDAIKKQAKIGVVLLITLGILFLALIVLIFIKYKDAILKSNKR